MEEPEIEACRGIPRLHKTLIARNARAQDSHAPLRGGPAEWGVCTHWLPEPPAGSAPEAEFPEPVRPDSGSAPDPETALHYAAPSDGAQIDWP